MNDTEQLLAAILEKLKTVIDPETGVDVVRMRLIEDLTVNDGGHVTYKFHPSSPLCPIAVPLLNMIQMAVADVTGVASQDVTVIDFALADELSAWFKETFGSG